MKQRPVRSILIHILIAAILAAVYVVLTEQFTPANAAIGFAVALIALLLTDHIFLSSQYKKAFTLSGWYFVYVLYLFFIILKSALFSLGYIFTKNVSVRMIPYQTSLKDDNPKNMLANAITLTPGTVTADLKDNTIEVMKLCKSSDIDQTKGFVQIENVIRRMERKTAA